MQPAHCAWIHTYDGKQLVRFSYLPLPINRKWRTNVCWKTHTPNIFGGGCVVYYVNVCMCVLCQVLFMFHVEKQCDTIINIMCVARVIFTWCKYAWRLVVVVDANIIYRRVYMIVCVCVFIVNVFVCAWWKLIFQLEQK